MTNTVIITSVIHFDKTRELSYSKVRSIYTTDDRISQTIESIESARKYLPNSSIIVVELGKSVDGLNKLVSSCDKFLFLGNNLLVRLAVDSKYKGVGEAIGLLVAASSIYNKFTNTYYKLSGRYCLNSKFNIAKWSTTKDNMFITAKVYRDTISTRFYGFRSNHWNKWVWGLISSIPKLVMGKSIEQTLYQYYMPNINQLSTIGVEGRIAVDGSLIKE